jgi:hypothetical protein
MIDDRSTQAPWLFLGRLFSACSGFIRSTAGLASRWRGAEFSETRRTESGGSALVLHRFPTFVDVGKMIRTSESEFEGGRSSLGRNSSCAGFWFQSRDVVIGIAHAEILERELSIAASKRSGATYTEQLSIIGRWGFNPDDDIFRVAGRALEAAHV